MAVTYESDKWLVTSDELSSERIKHLLYLNDEPKNIFHLRYWTEAKLYGKGELCI